MVFFSFYGIFTVAELLNVIAQWGVPRLKNCWFFSACSGEILRNHTSNLWNILSSRDTDGPYSNSILKTSQNSIILTDIWPLG